MSTPSDYSWGLFEWVGALLTAVVTAVLGYLNQRMGKFEDSLQQQGRDLRQQIDQVSQQDSDGRDDLRREVQTRLDAIAIRVDQTATKQDLHNMMLVIMGRPVQENG
jgi:hypothetical protein